MLCNSYLIVNTYQEVFWEIISALTMKGTDNGFCDIIKQDIKVFSSTFFLKPLISLCFSLVGIAIKCCSELRITDFL